MRHFAFAISLKRIRSILNSPHRISLSTLTNFPHLKINEPILLLIIEGTATQLTARRIEYLELNLLLLLFVFFYVYTPFLSVANLIYLFLNRSDKPLSQADQMFIVFQKLVMFEGLFVRLFALFSAANWVLRPCNVTVNIHSYV